MSLSRARAFAFLASIPFLLFLLPILLRSTTTPYWLKVLIISDPSYFPYMGPQARLLAIAQAIGAAIYAVGLVLSIILARTGVIYARMNKRVLRFAFACVAGGLLFCAAISFVIDFHFPKVETHLGAVILIAEFLVVASFSIVYLSSVITPLLLTLAAFGAALLILFPYGYASHEQAKQMATMADIRSLAVAVNNYRDAKGTYPDAISVDVLIAKTRPFWSGTIRREDAWGNPLIVRSSASTYRITSAGRDGRLDQGGSDGESAIGAYDRDIVYVDGIFTKYPYGIARQ